MALKDHEGENKELSKEALDQVAGGTIVVTVTSSPEEKDRNLSLGDLDTVAGGVIYHHESDDDEDSETLSSVKQESVDIRAIYHEK